MSLPLQVAFVAGWSGIWRIERITAVAGESLPPAERLAVIEGPEAQRPLEGSWILRDTTSNARYTNREELKALSVKREMLLRPQATRAALIPIRKTAAWWDLAQDERRAIFEEQKLRPRPEPPWAWLLRWSRFRPTRSAPACASSRERAPRPCARPE